MNKVEGGFYDGVAALPPSPTAHLAGMERAVAPAETVRRILAERRRLGITRVADVTGLDRVGIPVASAYRPNSRSISVFMGKGVTHDAARAGALMEALEAHHAEHITRPLRLARWRDVAEQALDPATLPQASRSRFHPDLPILWISGVDLFTRRERLVPYELVSLDFTVPAPSGSGCFAADSNGLAGGNTLVEAITHGLLEAIERDAFTLWKEDATRHAVSLVDPQTITEPRARDVIERLQQTGSRVLINDAMSDLGIPTFVARSFDSETGAVPDLGMGSHTDRDLTLLRALLELAQTRLTRIAGARDDLDAQTYSRESIAASFADIRPRDATTTTHFIAAADLRETLQAILERLAKRALREAVWIDLTHAELGIPVVKIVVPQLEGASHSLGTDHRPNARLRRQRGEVAA
jgi:ribosomal protein S12 methylthiotransferase accessory factor